MNETNLQALRASLGQFSVPGADEIPRLIPRDPVSRLGGNPLSVTIDDFVKDFPKIDPPEKPSLCDSCRKITLDDLIKSKKSTWRDKDGNLTTIVGASESRLAILWPNVRESFEHCAMCRLLSCDTVWRSGVSPYNRHYKDSGEYLELQLELSIGDEVTLWFPEQSGLEQDMGMISVFSEHGR
jgi:hypothetical protein